MGGIDPYLLALAAALLRAVADVAYRQMMKGSHDGLILALLNSALGGLVLLLLIGVPELGGSTRDWCLLVMANVFWALQLLFHLKALHYLDAAQNAILDVTRFILINAAAIVFFGEIPSALACLGLGLVALSITAEIREQPAGRNRGLYFRALSVLAGTSALAIEKHLTSRISIDLIIIGSFLLPAVMFIAVCPRKIPAAAKVLKTSPGPILATSLLYAGVAFCLTYAFGKGRLGGTMTIYQTSVVFTFLLGLTILKERQHWLRRALAAVLCIGGVALVSMT